MSRLLCVPAQRAYPSRCACAHASPVDTPQSCMSWHRSGTTKLTVGSRVKSAGKSLNGRLTSAGTAVKLTPGACLRAYDPPSVQPRYPGPGTPSAYTATVTPSATSWLYALAGP